MNPIEEKIRKAGGTMISEPLTNSDGSINQKCADELFATLEAPDDGLKSVANAAANRLLVGPSVSDLKIAGIIETACSLCVVTFTNAILHGDEVHRLWLLEAAEAFVSGKSIPPARAKTPIPKPD